MPHRLQCALLVAMLGLIGQPCVAQSPDDIRELKLKATLLVGLTRFAVDQLTDVTYIELPKAGAKVKAGEGMGEIESVKAVSDIYAPVSGEVVAVNGALAADASLVSRDPYGDGWLVRVRPDAVGPLDHLMAAEDYSKQTEGQ
jgi:glycine cleavage system H protein